jgi:hypothetical protein
MESLLEALKSFEQRGGHESILRILETEKRERDREHVFFVAELWTLRSRENIHWFLELLSSQMQREHET